MQYVVGIDGGGTACRAALADRQGRILGRGQAGAANIRTDLPGALANILAALAQAAAAADIAFATARTAPAVLGPGRRQYRQLRGRPGPSPALPGRAHRQ